VKRSVSGVFRPGSRGASKKDKIFADNTKIDKISDSIGSTAINNAALVSLVRLRELWRKNKKLKLFIFQHAETNHPI